MFICKPVYCFETDLKKYTGEEHKDNENVGLNTSKEHGKYFKMYEKKKTKGGLDETKIHPTARDTKKKNLKLIQKCRVTKRFSYTYNQSPLNIPLASNFTDFLTLLDINADFFLSFCVRTI